MKFRENPVACSGPFLHVHVQEVTECSSIILDISGALERPGLYRLLFTVAGHSQCKEVLKAFEFDEAGKVSAMLLGLHGKRLETLPPTSEELRCHNL